MRTSRVALALLTALICAAGEVSTGSQQGPPRDPKLPASDLTGRRRAPLPQTGTGAISGTVVALSSDQPLGDATVSIYGPALAEGRTSTTTDNLGRFEFSNLPAGRYAVGASKPGFVNFMHGQRYYGRGGREIPLRDGERREIRLTLPRTSVVTGMVVDERANPAVNASVRVLRFSMSNGYRRADSAGSATTDDRGIYRIHSLQPGDYAVCASTRSTGPLNEAQRLQMEIDRQRRGVENMVGPAGVVAQRELAPRLAALEARLPAHVDPIFGYGTVCHPGSASLPSMVRVAPGEERTGVDLRLVLTRLARVEGIVVGMPVLNTQMDPIMLVDADDANVNETARPNIEARFRFTNVPPGRYRLFLRGKGDGPSAGVPIGAAADVVVAGEDIGNVVLDLQRGATVAGQVVFKGAVPPDAAAVARMQVRMDPAELGRFFGYPGPSIVSLDASGRFVLSNVFPGKYLISATSRESMGWFVDSSTLAGQDVLYQPLAVEPNQSLSGVVITLTDRRAELAGTIVTDKGEPAPEYFILVYPSE